MERIPGGGGLYRFRPNEEDAEYDMPVYEFEHLRDRPQGHSRGHGHHREYESGWERPERNERRVPRMGTRERPSRREAERELNEAERAWRTHLRLARGFAQWHESQKKPDGPHHEPSGKREPWGKDEPQAQPDGPPLNPFDYSSSESSSGSWQPKNPRGANPPRNPRGNKEPNIPRWGNEPKNPPGGKSYTNPLGESTYGHPRNEVVNHYKTLGIPFGASIQDIAKAAKAMRIKVHPDRLIKPDSSKKEIAKINDAAARVGQAAEVLLNPLKKADHDAELRGDFGAWYE